MDDTVRTDRVRDCAARVEETAFERLRRAGRHRPKLVLCCPEFIQCALFNENIEMLFSAPPYAASPASQWVGRLLSVEFPVSIFRVGLLMLKVVRFV